MKNILSILFFFCTIQTYAQSDKDKGFSGSLNLGVTMPVLNYESDAVYTGPNYGVGVYYQFLHNLFAGLDIFVHGTSNEMFSSAGSEMKAIYSGFLLGLGIEFNKNNFFLSQEINAGYLTGRSEPFNEFTPYTFGFGSINFEHGKASGFAGGYKIIPGYNFNNYFSVGLYGQFLDSNLKWKIPFNSYFSGSPPDYTSSKVDGIDIFEEKYMTVSAGIVITFYFVSNKHVEAN